MGALADLREAWSRGTVSPRDAAPVDLYPRSHGYGSSLGGVSSTVGKGQALDVPDWNETIYAICDAQANGQSQITWRLYRQAASGKPEDRTPVPRHPALSVWSQPNRHFTQADLLETLSDHNELTGERWMVVGRATPGGPPIELWPIRPDRIRPVCDPREFLLGYEYNPTGRQADAVPLEIDEVVNDIRRHPKDPYRGKSPISSAMLKLRGTREADRYNTSFFTNDATPGGLLKLPKPLSEGEWKEQVARWNEQHRGASKAHKIHVMDNMEGADFVELATSRKDMQFVELQNVSVEAFMRAYRVDDFVLGRLRDVNRAAAEAAMAWFSITHQIPRANRTRDMLNHKFLPLFGPTLGKGYEFDYDDPVPPDREQALAENTSNLTNALTAIAAGVPEDEAFEYYGLPAWVLDKPETAVPAAPALPPVPAAARAASDVFALPPEHLARARRRRRASRVQRLRDGVGVG